MQELPHKILVVEDEPALQDLISKTLATNNRTVFGAGTLEEACKIVDQQKVDLIVLDRMLPDGDGIEFCAKLRRDPVRKAVPILFLSARSSADDKVLGLKLGADDYLAKPFDLNELKARVDALLRRAEELNRYRTRLH